MDEDDFPDDPPLEEDPFDSVFNQAIRYKCPGLNQRHTIFLLGSSRLCRKTRVITTPFQAVAIVAACKVVPWNLTPDYFKAFQACSSNPALVAAADAQVGYVKSLNLSCRTVEGFVFHSSSFMAKCNVRAEVPKEMVQARFPASCKFQRYAPNTSVGGQLCRKIHFVNTVAKTAIRYRRLCAIYYETAYTGKTTCRMWGLNPILNPVYIFNQRSCRPSEVVDYSTYVLAKLCNNAPTTGLVPDAAGTTSPHLAWQCRTYPEYVQEFTGNKLCLHPMRASENIIRFTVYGCRLDTFFPEGRIGHKIRCGTEAGAFAPALVFGRIWGGRDPFAYNSVRDSGRIVGKIRPSE